MPLSPDDLESPMFSRPVGRGYRADQVDAMVQRVYHVLAGTPDHALLPDLQHPGLNTTWRRWRAYDKAEVEAMLDLCSHEIATLLGQRLRGCVYCEAG